MVHANKLIELLTKKDIKGMVKISTLTKRCIDESDKPFTMINLF